jgi:hypothetical protein
MRQELKVLAFLAGFLGLLLGLWGPFLFAVNNESSPRLLFVPFEAS